MPLTLSIPETGVSTEVPELAMPMIRGGGVVAPFQFEAGEPIAGLSQIGTALLTVDPALFRHLRFGESIPEEQTWLSHERENGKTSVIGKEIPRLKGLDVQDPVLTSSVRRLLTALCAVVVSRALQVNFPLDEVKVSIFEDPTEQERKAILRLVCSASLVQALAFWDSLEPDLQNWLETLTENDRITFVTRMGLRVHWR